MTEQQYLFGKLAEEAAEIAQMCSKINCFGIDEVYPDEAANPDKLTNNARLYLEVTDLLAVMDMLEERGFLPDLTEEEKTKLEDQGLLIEKKKEKIAKYMQLSRNRGHLK